MDLIRACGTCARRILQWSIRGSTMSSAKRVCPVHFERASTLRKARPTTLKSFSSCAYAPLTFAPSPFAFASNSILFVTIDALSRERGLLAAHPCGGQLDRLVDLDRKSVV